MSTPHHDMESTDLRSIHQRIEILTAAVERLGLLGHEEGTEGWATAMAVADAANFADDGMLFWATAAINIAEDGIEELDSEPLP